MKFVRESLLEFERGLDPKEAMGIGIIDKMKEDLKKLGYEPGSYEILSDLTIKAKATGHYWRDNFLKLISLKYQSPSKYKFVLSIKFEEKKSTRKNDVESAIDEALKNNISPEDIEILLKEWAENSVAKEGHLYLLKQTRNKENKESDDENNVYAFIGFMDKVPVKSTKYYEDKFNTETIIKIDTFDINAHKTLNMMKIRARVQYPNGDVYFVRISKFLMNEDRYESIPPECYDIFVKYKQKV